ncbi:unnamed protein product [Hermetia illucens]|nr:unnamed protein product [Hermetia illucens]
MQAQVITLAFFVVIITFTSCYGSSSRSAELKEIWAREYNDTLAGKCTKRVPANPNNDGSPSDSATVLIEVCCKGYKPYEYDTKKCIPDCPYGCENGFCVSPNVCNCFDDHIRSHDDQCVPTCPISCLNGVCDSNGMCTCHPRHILDPFRKFCLPICHGSCGLNRYCSSPGRCSCIRGFKENLETGECDPICPLNCLNGRCISPGICACNPGYRLQDDVCQANCTSCENGKCVINEVCSCDPGYTWDLKRNKCIPVCTRCLNGFCIAPGVCKCHEGYERIGESCQPICDGGCTNGYCVAPNTCNCKGGYGRNIFGKCKRLRCHIADDTKSICGIKHLG